MWVLIFSIFKRAAKQSLSSPLFPLPTKIVTDLALLLAKKFLADEDALSIKRKEVSFVLTSLSSINLDFVDPNKSNEILAVSKSYCIMNRNVLKISVQKYGSFARDLKAHKVIG